MAQIIRKFVFAFDEQLQNKGSKGIVIGA